ncbi:hypothetical protein [uncultured Aureimonas sp.]|uniref:hypothetical protein n=1 Tax=uncultured Aureimonas sp. TaxID=1604662 RepID=UPI0025E1F4F4|nr:hypothetical protein [uncultured Aureimonas sp.]
MTTQGLEPARSADETAALEAVTAGALGRDLGLTPAHLDVALRIADGLRRRGAHAEALRMCATIVLCEPRRFEFQAALAACALEADQPYVAIQAAAAMIAEAPRDPRGYLLSGRACLRAGEWAEAIEDLSNAADRANEAGRAAEESEARNLLAGLRQASQQSAPRVGQFAG